MHEHETTSGNISDKELVRAYLNSFLSPEYDDHIPIEDDSYFEKIYGKERWAKTKKQRRKGKEKK